MKPATAMAIVERQIKFAESVAAGHREAASLCSNEQEALRARLEQGAKAIEVLVALIRAVAFSAQLNHDTIAGRRHELSSKG